MIAEKPEEVPEPTEPETKPPKSETVEKPVASGQDNAASAWAAEAVRWCVDNGILLGDQNGDLMLHQPLTREQACLVVKRMYDLALRDIGDRAVGEVARRMIAAMEDM